MKIVYGTSFPAPQTLTPGPSGPLVAAAGVLAAPKAVSEIGRLTRQAYEALRQDNIAVELLSVDRRGFLGTLFSAGALVFAAGVTADEAAAADVVWQPAVYLGFEPNGQIVITAPVLRMDGGLITALTGVQDTGEKATGHAGNVSVEVDRLSLAGGAFIDSRTTSEGQGGSVQVTVRESAVLTGNSGLTTVSRGSRIAGGPWPAVR